MEEYVSSQIRYHEAPKNFLGQLGQSFRIFFFDKSTQTEIELGYILSDGRFSPPYLKNLIKDKVENHKAVTLPVCLEVLAIAKIPINDLLLA